MGHCRYRAIWYSKYGRILFSSVDVKARFIQICRQTAEEMGAVICDMALTDNRVDITYELPERVAPYELPRRIKRGASTALRAEFPDLKKRFATLWSDGYLVMTCGAPSGQDDLIADFDRIEQSKRQKPEGYEKERRQRIRDEEREAHRRAGEIVASDFSPGDEVKLLWDDGTVTSSSIDKVWGTRAYTQEGCFKEMNDRLGRYLALIREGNSARLFPADTEEGEDG